MAAEVFYGDGSSCKEAPYPARNVQAILQPHSEVGTEIVTGGDYYVLEQHGWRAVDIFGLFDFLQDSGLVLFGRTVTAEEYQQVMNKALAAKKNGWLPFERKA